jgi:hypothetical protein
MSNKEQQNLGELPEDFVDEADSQGEVTLQVEEDSESIPIQAQDEGVQTEFRHVLLQGKRPEEIDRIVASLEAATREQGRELSRLTAQQNQLVDPTPPPPPSQEEYFNNPGQAIRNEVQLALRDAIEPFKRDLAASNARSVWDTVAARHPDFEVTRPLIEVYLQKNPNIPVTEESLSTLYYTAKGYMAENAPVAARPSSSSAPSPAPPQHAASSHPIPQQKKKTATRQLTENERRLARERGFSDAQYLQWLELSEDEVLTAEVI